MLLNIYLRLIQMVFILLKGLPQKCASLNVTSIRSLTIIK